MNGTYCASFELTCQSLLCSKLLKIELKLNLKRNELNLKRKFAETNDSTAARTRSLSALLFLISFLSLCIPLSACRFYVFFFLPAGQTVVELLTARLSNVL